MYRINLKPREQELEGSELSALIDLWLADLRTRLPLSTVDGYEIKIAYFRDWWRQCGPALGWSLNRSALAKFNRWLTDDAMTKQGKCLSYHTRNDVVRRLRQLFRWGLDREYLPIDVTPWLPAVEGSAPLRVAPDLSAVERLIEAGQRSGPRDMALLAVFLGTGIRRAEAAGLDVSDVVLYADQSGTLTIRHAKRVRKREVQARVVAFDSATGYYLADWLNQCTASGPLFPTSHIDRPGERLTPQGVYKVIKRLVSEAGLSAIVQGPHDLRRLFATTFARHRKGAGSDSLLSRQMGHSASGMTARYMLFGAEDLRAEIISPIALLNRRSSETA